MLTNHPASNEETTRKIQAMRARIAVLRNELAQLFNRAPQEQARGKNDEPGHEDSRREER